MGGNFIKVDISKLTRNVQNVSLDGVYGYNKEQDQQRFENCFFIIHNELLKNGHFFSDKNALFPFLFRLSHQKITRFAFFI